MNMQNFGKIKNVFNEIMVEGLIRKDAKRKDIFKQYLKLIKENEVLKAQFFIYDNIENKVESNELKATIFLQENLALLKKFTKKQIQEANVKLALPILFEQEIATSFDELHENISKLILTEKNAKNIDAVVEATSFIINYIMNNTVKEITEAIELPNSMISTILVDNYNEKYSDLNESEKELLKALLGSDDVKKKEIYSTTLRECIDLIDTKLGNSDVETKDKLLRVKDKLLNDKQEINEDYIKNITKMVDLKSSLK